MSISRQCAGGVLAGRGRCARGAGMAVMEHRRAIGAMSTGHLWTLGGMPAGYWRGVGRTSVEPRRGAGGVSAGHRRGLGEVPAGLRQGTDGASATHKQNAVRPTRGRRLAHLESARDAPAASTRRAAARTGFRFGHRFATRATRRERVARLLANRRPIKIWWRIRPGVRFGGCLDHKMRFFSRSAGRDKNLFFGGYARFTAPARGLTGKKTRFYGDSPIIFSKRACNLGRVRHIAHHINLSKCFGCSVGATRNVLDESYIFL